MKPNDFSEFSRGTTSRERFLLGVLITMEPKLHTFMLPSGWIVMTFHAFEILILSINLCYYKKKSPTETGTIVNRSIVNHA